MSKPWYTSKTIWTNLALLAVQVASGQLGVAIPPAYAVPVAAVANIVLRLLTSQPVA